MLLSERHTKPKTLIKRNGSLSKEDIVHHRPRLSPPPRSSVVSVRKRRDKFRNMDLMIRHAIPSSRLSSGSQSEALQSSTILIPPPISQQDSHRRATSARLPSNSSRPGDVPHRQSSLKHRMLNRLASGLLPPQNVLEPKSPDFSQNEPPILVEPQRQEVSKAVLNVYQADSNCNSSTYFAVDVGCSLSTRGDLPLDVAFLIDNS